MQQLKKYVLTIMAMVYCVHFCAAQATDSVLLSVFNTGAKYRLAISWRSSTESLKLRVD